MAEERKNRIRCRVQLPRRMGTVAFGLTLMLGVVSGADAATRQAVPQMPRGIASASHTSTASARSSARSREVAGNAAQRPVHRDIKHKRAMPVTAAAGIAGMEHAPAVAIVIDDLGPDEAQTRAAIGLPATVTLSFLPYADDAAKLAREAE
ncbi:MAG: divergent polysaccharide deacetylase family protein, partial [Alphaproteobacteria bacterium]|nr:divergent polysaccharide deacetylase family protein [Alphaproteobacteria bacterium]